MKNPKLMTGIAIGMVVVGLILVIMAFSSFQALGNAKSNMNANEATAAEAQASGDITKATKYTNYATFDAIIVNKHKKGATMSTLAAIFMIGGGVFVYKKRKK